MVATEAATEILTDSKLFQPLRYRVRQRAYPEGAGPPDTAARGLWAWLDALVSCGYCLSVWVAALFAPLLPGYPPSPTGPWSFYYLWSWARVALLTALLWWAYGLLIHRLSNWAHVGYELLRRGRVLAHDVTVRSEEAVK